MTLSGVLIGILLLVLLAVFTLLINPPNAWVNRERDADKNKDPNRR